MILTACHSVTVSAAARLHMGFLDLNGGLGRRYGSLGLALEELATTVTVRVDDTVAAEGPQSERAAAYARAALRALDSGAARTLRAAGNTAAERAPVVYPFRSRPTA